jgi:CRISPR/Cas system-associated protein endoribonuclease Cas2
MPLKTKILQFIEWIYINKKYLNILMTNLHNVISSGYKNAHTQRQNLLKDGYLRDSQLSNHNKQVYFNKEKNDMIYNVSGTHNLKDIGTNIYLATGNIKKTNRYLEAHEGLRQIKLYYKVNKATVSGDSLGGNIAGYISSKNDNVVSLNKAAVVGQRVRGNEKAFRVSGDVVSLMNANSKHMNTIKNQGMTTPYAAHVPSSIINHRINI